MRRRELFGWAFAGAVATTPGLAAASSSPPGLAAVLGADQVALFVVRDLVAGGTLGAAAAAVARQIERHEEAHVQLLAVEVARRGEPLPSAPTTAAAADRRLAELNGSGRLASVHTQDDALRLLYDVESIVIGRCWEALRTLADPSVVRTTVEIMGSEAQHASAIGGLLHPGKWARVVPVGLLEGKH